ncbi:hypothetical protein ACES2J_07325 [Bdellovibrio bacteriovorus]|uniref:hypothetical protein n=1 Tax=Bdellovibrio bacteriovorus TaxID=959 RepID=UPI0035A5B0C8
MLAAMDIVRNVVDNHVLAKAIDEARSNISEGESIAGPLKKSGQFPPYRDPHGEHRRKNRRAGKHAKPGFGCL